MSIRQFSIQPCPDCGQDTVHVAMKCRNCGHINLTPTQIRSKGRRYRRLLRSKYGFKRLPGMKETPDFAGGVSRERFKEQVEARKQARIKEKSEFLQFALAVVSRRKR